MSGHELSEFEKARARKLGQELTNKLAEYFPNETTDEQMAEVCKLRDELEKMGFRVEWSVGVDLKTGAGTASIKLWLPKAKDGETTDTGPENTTPPQE